MPDHISKISLDEEATSNTCPKAYQQGWMSHWAKKNPKVTTRVNDSSFIQACHNNRLVDFGTKTNISPSNPSLPKGFSRHGKGVVEDSKDPEFGTTNLSLALALGRAENSTDLNFRNESKLRSHEKHGVSKYCLPTRRSEKADISSPVVVFEKHFSNDNFTCFGKDSCKYQKYSSLLLHETDMKNDLTYEASQKVDRLPLQHDLSENKKFEAIFGKNHGKSRLSEKVSVHETMRICTMVDSLENSPEGYHKISQRAHHVLFTKQMCANLHDDNKTLRAFNMSQGFPPSRPSGVKIQPLWTSTESEEKESTENSSILKASFRNEDSDLRQEDDPQSRYTHTPDMTSSALHKYTMGEPSAYNSTEEKTSNKMRISEIPDINEELPGVHLQVVVNSSDNEGPNTSRVHCLNDKYLSSNKRQALNHSCNESQDHSISPETSIKCTDPGNRWIKRLKRSSSDSIGVGTKSSSDKDSCHAKFNTFFNKIVEPKLLERHGKEPCETEQISDSILSKGDHGTMVNSCSWIQRWCQNKNKVSKLKNKVLKLKNPEPNVICDPHSLKVGQEEHLKKQFPSIGALALMGKAMNGYRTCEFSKKGSVVVWNTREF